MYLKSAKAAREFDLAVITALATLFGVSPSLFGDRTEFAFITDAGTLRGGLYLCSKLDGMRKWSPVWLHFRFDDVEAAKRVVCSPRLNPYSGKWNFHLSGDREAVQDVDIVGMVNEIRALNPTNFRFI